ncbi:MAG: ethanolamine ammonia-lyase reactivating factor EutA [Oscillospiraceae bacterium]|nr:ethanolamine ammonia-lyase reactivating factor EutA [Oscillospiraceae bacterium]
MAERLLSVGLDVGTTTTQLIVSRLCIENSASAFSVPDLRIAGREILYKSAVHFTPLLNIDRIDGEGIRAIVEAEYKNAGIQRGQVDTGAIIITGETSRKENAQAVAAALSDFAGDFVVATAGPDLESCLAARGAGAVDFSEKTGNTVLHMDIGGGTSNLALIEDGSITKTGCLNVGGRLLKFDETGALTYISPVLEGLFRGQLGHRPALSQLQELADTLVSALEMAAGLRAPTDLLDKLTTTEADPAGHGPMWSPVPTAQNGSNAGMILSFSGGVADCIEREHPFFAFGDMGPILGRAIRKSRLCAGPYRLGDETIRATVIGAGSHSAQLSGSTVLCKNITFPLKNLPAIVFSEAQQERDDLHERIARQLQQYDGSAVLALPGYAAAHYSQIVALADRILAGWGRGPILLALENDMAKALGQAIALRTGSDRPILCIDRVRLTPGSYLDVGAPIGPALPVVIKTLIFSR